MLHCSFPVFTRKEKTHQISMSSCLFSKDRDRWLKTRAIDTHTGEKYSITLLDPKGRTRKLEVKCYGNVLGAYREHPEAKFLGHDGKVCCSLTRGLLRRSRVVAGAQRYIGKETSRQWEQGDDISLVGFQCNEYSDGRAVADEATRKLINEGRDQENCTRNGNSQRYGHFDSQGQPSETEHTRDCA